MVSEITPIRISAQGWVSLTSPASVTRTALRIKPSIEIAPLPVTISRADVWGSVMSRSITAPSAGWHWISSESGFAVRFTSSGRLARPRGEARTSTFSAPISVCTAVLPEGFSTRTVAPHTAGASSPARIQTTSGMWCREETVTLDFGSDVSNRRSILP